MATITGMTADKISAIVAMQPIAKQVLAAGAASVTFSAIPATPWNHLKLKVSRPAFAAADYSLVRLNGDVTVGRYFYGSATVAAVADTAGFPPFMKNASSMAAGFDIEINSVASTVLQKPMFAKAASIGAVVEQSVGGGYNQAVAINSITVITSGGQLYPTGSEFYLYGVI